MIRKILLTLTGGILTMPACRPTQVPVVVGHLADVESHLRRLAAQSHDAFLIIQAGADDAFLQLKFSADGFELDHPLVTPAQRARASEVRAFCSERQLRLQENHSTDGTLFLDCYLPADPAIAAQHVTAALITLLGATEATELRFARAA